MRRSDIDEWIVDLYLRLSGYLTTGLIIHSSEWGQTSTEVDRIALRNKYHSQSEREVSDSDFLKGIEGKADLLICEVKNNKYLLRFNDALINDLEAIGSVLRWVGLFPGNEIEEISKQLQDLFIKINSGCKNAAEGIEFDQLVIRALLCCPAERQFERGWILSGQEVFSYINSCLYPMELRSNCSTRYNFQQWGYPFAEIIRYFKDSANGNPNIDGLYQYLESS